MSSLRFLSLALVGAGLVAAGSAQSFAGAGRNDISSSSGAVGGPFFGRDINALVGANRFYSQGYTGTRAVVTNIEAGHVWSGHESLGHVSTFLTASGYAGSQLGQFDRHATWVGQTIGGRGSMTYQKGIAYGADLWSGAIATSWVGTAAYRLSFGWSRNQAALFPYEQALLNGVRGRKTDVVNSSWGYGVASGNNVLTFAFDGMARQSGKTVVASAGNSGPGANTVGGMAAGYNTISVGALNDDTGPNPYSTLASFSSRSPNTYTGPDGTVAGARARVDIAAPGAQMTLAYYGGPSGGWNGGSVITANNFYQFNLAGTSFAAPTVAGGATLLADTGYDKFGGGSSVDGRVIKSVLQTSATKLAGWNNGQSVSSGGLVTTTQALDYGIGAGALNLDRAFDVYTAGTTDVPGDAGGLVKATGWDLGKVSANQTQDYRISQWLEGGTTFTATLNWFVGRIYNGVLSDDTIQATDSYFTNLGLELYDTGGSAMQLVAQSKAAYINTEHFSFNLARTSTYMLRVTWDGVRYGSVSNETYGLSWMGTASAVPEPGTMAALGLGALALLRRRRRQS